MKKVHLLLNGQVACGLHMNRRRPVSKDTTKVTCRACLGALIQRDQAPEAKEEDKDEAKPSAIGRDNPEVASPTPRQAPADYRAPYGPA